MHGALPWHFLASYLQLRHCACDGRAVISCLVAGRHDHQSLRAYCAYTITAYCADTCNYPSRLMLAVQTQKLLLFALGRSAVATKQSTAHAHSTYVHYLLTANNPLVTNNNGLADLPSCTIICIYNVSIINSITSYISASSSQVSHPI
jgi:hypothetical protein